MRDPQRIDDFCARLQNAWHTLPDWRFGQLLMNIFGREDIFYQEDEELIKRIEDFSKLYGIKDTVTIQTAPPIIIKDQIVMPLTSSPDIISDPPSSPPPLPSSPVINNDQPAIKDCDDVKIIELFSGIGAQIQALKNLGLAKKSVAVSEINPFAIQAYMQMHGPTPNLGDISKININTIKSCDIMTYSFPCQDISSMGKLRGLDQDSNTRSSLLWECERIIEAVRPKYLLMENVKNLISIKFKDQFDLWLELLEKYGYTNYYTVLNANCFGLPQNRERVFCVSILNATQPFEFDLGAFTHRCIKDLLQPFEEIDKKYYIDKVYTLEDHFNIGTSGIQQIGTVVGESFESRKKIYSLDGLAPTLLASGKTNVKIIDHGQLRYLTPLEFFRFMGFSDECFKKIKNISDTQLYKLAGNSIAVPVLESIFSRLFL